VLTAIPFQQLLNYAPASPPCHLLFHHSLKLGWYMPFGHFGPFRLSLPGAAQGIASVPEVGAGTTLFLFAAPTHRSSR
jgi:hypothetical protein